ncbi:sensor histidine kinase [Streptomyces radiopugnans]|uniref:sensor histidine kinase n=1 Tax=Streptomyces radiopugnans TaxID=403935 RepID=UPI000B8351AC|nr:histidine kinase [Streptomyces radiopugnans]
MTETGESVGARDQGDAPRGPLWWTRRRSAVLDVVLALASGAECAAQGVPFARDAGVPVGLSVALGALAGLALVLRRRWPIAVVLVAIAVTPAQMGFLLGTVGLYTLAASEVPRRIIGLLAGMQGLGTLVVSAMELQRNVGRDDYGYDPPAWFVPLVSVLMSLGVTAPPVLLGLYAGARRRLVESLRERADGLERELSLLADRAEERAEWARNEERTRIAREMHDVVAHRVSLMVVHAAALQAVARKDPEKASRNAALIGDMGRQALTELRTMLGVLRAHEGKSTGSAQVPGGVSAGSVESERPLARVAEVAEVAAAAVVRGPAEGPGGPAESAEGLAGGSEESGGPCLRELDALVGQSRAAGMPVELSVEGEVRSYARRVEQTAYRVIQEALTNVHKHAAGARTRVRLARRAGEVAVLVENEAPTEGVRGAGLPSGGNGLVGMRERVAALGGGFVSGPTEAGGFRVSAVIPDRG